MQQIAYEPEIKIVLDSGDIHESPHIQSFYIYRIPFAKIASFSMLILPLPAYFILKMDDELKQNKRPLLYIKIYLADTTKRGEKYGYYKSKLIYNQVYRVLHLYPKQPLTKQTYVVTCGLYLAQLQLYDMSVGNSYNKILRKLTALDAISKFESYINDRYGNCFKFKKVYDDDHKNEDEYEQILYKVASDILVPQFIFQNYKPFTTLGYYFFDEFSLTNGFLTGFSISLGEKDAFEKFDIYNQGYEIPRSLRLKGVIQFNDRFSYLRENLSDTSYVIKNKSGLIKVNKSDNQVEVPKITVNLNSQKYLEDVSRKVNIYPENLNVNIQSSDSNLHTMIYTPEKFDTAISRYENIKTLMDEEFESLCQFEIYETHVDAIQFNRIYNFDYYESQNGSNKYNYVPISIVNVFNKINPHESTLRHSCLFQAIKYKDD